MEKTIKLPDSLGAFVGNGYQVWDSVDNKLFIGGDSGVLVIDGSTSKRLAIVPIEGSARAICYSPVEHKVYCATSAGKVAVLSGITNQLVTTITAGEYPYVICCNSQSNKVYVGNGDSSSVTIVDCIADTVLAIVRDVPHPEHLCYVPGRNKVYSGSEYGGVHSVTVLVGAGDTVLSEVPIGTEVSSFAYDPHDDKMYVATPSDTVVVIDCSVDTVRARISGSNSPRFVYYDSQDNRVYATSWGYAGVVAVIDCNADTMLAAISAGTLPNQDGMCYNPQDNKVYCGVEGSDPPRVQVIDCATNTVVRTLTAYSRSFCYNSAEDVVYCTDDGGSVIVIDGVNNEVVGVIASSDLPYAFCYLPQHNKVYCACYNSRAVVTIDAATNELTARIPTGLGARNLCYNPLGDKVYCVSELSGTLTVVDAAADTVLANIVDLGVNDALCYSSRHNKVYCVGDSGRLVVLDGAADTVVGRIDVGEWPSGLEYNAENDKVYVQMGYPTAGVTVIDAGADTILTWLNLAMVGDQCFSPVQNRMYFECSPGHLLAVVDGASDSVLTTIDLGHMPGSICFDSTDDRVYCVTYSNFPGDTLLAIDCATNAVVAKLGVPYGSRNLCYGHENNRVYLTSQDDTVTVTDAASSSIVAKVDVGGSPEAMVWDSAQGRLYVTNRDGYISVIRDSGAGVEETVGPQGRGTRLASTVVHGVIFLAEAASHKPQAASLMDATGRKVMDLKPGANDVRSLAPGVYFVREGLGARGEGLGKTRKIVLTK